MAINSVNYSMPVTVNGFLCKNCTDVDLAKAHIDPRHPSAGPYGANAAADPSLAGKQFDDQTGAVIFGGSLSGGSSDRVSSSPTSSPPRGSQLDLFV